MVREKRTDGLCIFESLSLSWGTGVLAVVGKLMCETSSSNSVTVHDGCTTTSNHCPDATGGVKDRQLEGRTGGGVELLDVCWVMG